MSSITTYGVIAEMRLSALGTRNAGTPLACVLPLQGHRAGLPSFFPDILLSRSGFVESGLLRLLISVWSKYRIFGKWNYLTNLC